MGSAFDADSEGSEGKYYTWKYDDLKNLLKEKFAIINKSYDISENGNFEGLNILTEKDNLKLNEEELKEMSIVKKILHDERNKELNLFLTIKYKLI